LGGAKNDLRLNYRVDTDSSSGHLNSQEQCFCQFLIRARAQRAQGIKSKRDPDVCQGWTKLAIRNSPRSVPQQRIRNPINHSPPNGVPFREGRFGGAWQSQKFQLARHRATKLICASR